MSSIRLAVFKTKILNNNLCFYCLGHNSFPKGQCAFITDVMDRLLQLRNTAQNNLLSFLSPDALLISVNITIDKGVKTYIDRSAFRCINARSRKPHLCKTSHVEALAH